MVRDNHLELASEHLHDIVGKSVHPLDFLSVLADPGRAVLLPLPSLVFGKVNLRWLVDEDETRDGAMALDEPVVQGKVRDRFPSG
jgi:hypothetical protein